MRNPHFLGHHDKPGLETPRTRNPVLSGACLNCLVTPGNLSQKHVQVPAAAASRVGTSSNAVSPPSEVVSNLQLPPQSQQAGSQPGQVSGELCKPSAGRFEMQKTLEQMTLVQYCDRK